MPKKTQMSPEDLAALEAAMKGTKPLKQNKIRLTPPIKKTARSVRPSHEEDETLHLNESLALDPVQSEEFIAFKQPAISNKILRNLRKGQYNVEAILDLHGMSVDQARTAVERFLQRCLHEKIRVALIIHGKGHHSQMPILKNKLNHWLRELNIILAFCSAAPGDGSRGAIYVLLKQNVGENHRG
jgi:DNA-nicking Smr family endonuclease